MKGIEGVGRTCAALSERWFRAGMTLKEMSTAERDLGQLSKTSKVMNFDLLTFYTVGDAKLLHIDNSPASRQIVKSLSQLPMIYHRAVRSHLLTGKRGYWTSSKATRSRGRNPGAPAAGIYIGKGDQYAVARSHGLLEHLADAIGQNRYLHSELSHHDIDNGIIVIGDRTQRKSLEKPSCNPAVNQLGTALDSILLGRSSLPDFHSPIGSSSFSLYDSLRKELGPEKFSGMKPNDLFAEMVAWRCTPEGRQCMIAAENVLNDAGKAFDDPHWFMNEKCSLPRDFEVLGRDGQPLVFMGSPRAAGRVLPYLYRLEHHVLPGLLDAWSKV